MALLAETLVEEWLNRNGYFTIRGIKAGVQEMDLLAIRPKSGDLEARHVEVQVSVNPVAYIAPLTEKQARLYGRKKTSVWARPADALPIAIDAWVEKKFFSKTKVDARNRAWPNLDWSYFLVHGKVKYPEELDLIRSHGIKTIPFYDVLSSLCSTIVSYSRKWCMTGPDVKG